MSIMTGRKKYKNFKNYFCDNFPDVSSLTRQTFVVQFRPRSNNESLNFKEKFKSKFKIKQFNFFSISVVFPPARHRVIWSNKLWSFSEEKNMSLNLWLSVLTRNVGHRSRWQEMKNLTNIFFWGLMLSLYL